MHDNNKKWLDDLKQQYPNNFSNAKILEVGSRDWNGSVRSWFKDCEYHGIDIVNGDHVDQVVSAKDFFRKSKNKYNTIISFSVLEHDKNWKHSLTNIGNVMNKKSLLFMCWGAEGNIRHNEPWALVPHQEVLDYLYKLGFKILDNFFEEDRYGKNCAGCYNVVAKKI